MKYNYFCLEAVVIGLQCIASNLLYHLILFVPTENIMTLHITLFVF